MPVREILLSLLVVSTLPSSALTETGRSGGATELRTERQNDEPLSTAELPFAIVYPLMVPRKTSDFGSRRHPVLQVSRHHSGVDLAAPEGTPIRAIKAGTVIFSDPHGAYGNLVVVRHVDGWSSHYGHLSDMKVLPGSKIRTGQIIGSVGSTGVSTGPHLHFEIRKEGKPLDPNLYIPLLTAAGEG